MRDVPLDGLRSGSRGVLSPERLDDPVGRNHFAPVDQEKDEERPLEPRRNPDLAAFRVANADRTEDVEVHVTVPGERAYHPDRPASTGALPRQTDLRASPPRLVDIRPPRGAGRQGRPQCSERSCIAIAIVVAVTISAVALAAETAETARTDGVEPGWQKALGRFEATHSTGSTTSVPMRSNATTANATPEWAQALIIRSDALNRKYHLGSHAQQPTTADATPEWARALDHS